MKYRFNLSSVDLIALVLVIIGAVNWGLVGLAHFLTTGGNWNLVNVLVGAFPTVEFGIYLIVGLAAIWAIYMASRIITASSAKSVGEMEAQPRA